MAQGGGEADEFLEEEAGEGDEEAGERAIEAVFEDAVGHDQRGQEKGVEPEEAEERKGSAGPEHGSAKDEGEMDCERGEGARIAPAGGGVEFVFSAQVVGEEAEAEKEEEDAGLERVVGGGSEAVPECCEGGEGELWGWGEGERAEKDKSDGGEEEANAAAPEESEPARAPCTGVKEDEVEGNKEGSGGDNFLGECAGEEGEGGAGGPCMAKEAAGAVEGADGGVEGAENPEGAEQLEALNDVGDGLGLERVDGEEHGNESRCAPCKAVNDGTGHGACSAGEEVAGDEIDEESVEDVNSNVDEMPAGQGVAARAVVEPECDEGERALGREGEDGTQRSAGVVEFEDGAVVIELPGAIQTVAVDDGSERDDKEGEEIEANEAEIGRVHGEAPMSRKRAPWALEAARAV